MIGTKLSDEKKDYLDVKYDKNEKPLTNFPEKLIHHLVEKFQLDPNSVILELGCGRCETLRVFSELGFSAFGVDSSKKSKEYAPNSIKEVKISDLENDELPFSSEQFDIIFSKSVIEHISDPSSLMKEILRILKPGGIVITLTPEWVSQIETFYEDPTHVHPYQPKGLEDLLIMSGFTDTSSEIFFYHEYLWNSTFWRSIASILQKFISTKGGRRLSTLTGNKFLRWSVEKQVLGVGKKPVL